MIRTFLYFCIAMSICHDAVANDLRDYVAAALTDNYALISSALGVEEQVHQLKVSRAGLLPNVNLSASYAWNRNTSFADNAADSQDRFDQQNYSLSLSQSLFDLETILGVKGARLSLSRKKLELERDRIDTMNNVINAYFGYLRAYAQHRTTHSELQSSNERVAQIRRSHELGNVARTDVFEAEADRARVISTLEVQENALELARQGLIEVSLLKGDPSRDIGDDIEIIPISKTAYQGWKNYTHHHNFDFLISQKQVETARNDVNARAARFAPNVSLNANYARSRSNNDGAMAPPMNGHSQSESVTLNLSAPIFAGGSNIYGLKAVRSAYKIARNDFLDTQNRVMTELNDAYLNVNSSVRSVAILQGAVELNRQSYKKIQKAYELGSRSLTDVAAAEAALFNAIRDYNNARYDYLIHLSDFHQINGSLNFAMVEELSSQMIAIEGVGGSEDQTIGAAVTPETKETIETGWRPILTQQTARRRP